MSLFGLLLLLLGTSLLLLLLLSLTLLFGCCCCSVGPFQSDALVVPHSCIFDQLRNSKLCQTYDAWNKSTTTACIGRSMIQQSFTVLQPCAVNRFSGAEFVCCPVFADVTHNDDDDDDDYDDNDDDGWCYKLITAFCIDRPDIARVTTQKNTI